VKETCATSEWNDVLKVPTCSPFIPSSATSQCAVPFCASDDRADVAYTVALPLMSLLVPSRKVQAHEHLKDMFRPTPPNHHHKSCLQLLQLKITCGRSTVERASRGDVGARTTLIIERQGGRGRRPTTLRVVRHARPTAQSTLVQLPAFYGCIRIYCACKVQCGGPIYVSRG
jgi:hypothetical protein